ncbi:hypothetical protein TNCV_3569091 [Trichonephila clavipes]|nr:hypothetical protein TNCV_3569091 [Trichonephila clavipes]
MEKEYCSTDMLQENYPRRRNGSEYYSKKKKKPFIKDRSGEREISTRRKGNGHYLQWVGKPLLLRKPNGEHYLAHNRKGFQLIPWNLLAEYAINNEPYLFTKDVLGNNVYVRQSELPQRLSAICQCVCNILFDCPVALNALGCCLLRA